MESFKLNTYRNFIVAAFLFFIPFSYALTFKIGFPLKLSEIALLTIFFLLLSAKQLKIDWNIVPVLKTLTIFCLISVISLIINLFWQYDYELENYEARFGYKVDSLLKFGYLILAYFCFIISYRVFSKFHNYALRIYLNGALVASIYCWYLFFSSLFKFPVLLLPGMDDYPQSALLSFGSFIRTGTFKEGNYMGMFLLLSGIMAFYCNRKKLACFLFLTIIPTVSSMAFINCFLFIFLYYFKRFFTKKNLSKLLLFFSGLTIVFILGLGNKDFKFLVTSKIFSSTKKIDNNAQLSKADRINSSMTAFNIGIHNPFLGVGMSNYGLHSKEHNYDPRFYRPNFKWIPNNVYMEIFSEQGAIALIVFLVFLIQLYRIAKQQNAVPLRYGLITSIIYFLAFPTYTILFIWVYFALVASLPNIHLFPEHANHN